MNSQPRSLDDPPLTSAQFHILVALAQSKSHGYGIMQEIEERTGGAVELGPGTLYRSIKQLLARGLIAEVGFDESQASNSLRQRRCYELTQAGRIRAAEEARRLRELVEWANDALVPEGGRS